MFRMQSKQPFSEFPELKYSPEELQVKKEQELLKATFERAYSDPQFRLNHDVQDLLDASMDHLVQSLGNDDWMFEKNH